MSKIVSLLTARPQIGKSAFTRWLVDDCLPRALPMLPDAKRCVVYMPRLVRPKPGAETPPNPPYAAIVETWFSGGHVGAALPFMESGFAEYIQEAHDYGVAEWTVKDDRAAARRGMSPGVVLWTILRKVPGLSVDQFSRYWTNHAPLAVRVHVGMAAYCQNRIDTVLTPNAPEFDGFAALHFRTEEDLRDRLFTSVEDVNEVLADSAKFSGNSIPMECSEYVVLAGS